MFGRQVLMLALQKPGAHNLFAIVRPNTGPSYFDMDIEVCVCVRGGGQALRFERVLLVWAAGWSL